MDIQFVKGVGPRFSKVLAKLSIYTVEDFQNYYPKSYEDRRFFTNLNNLQHHQPVSFIGNIVSMEEVKRNKFSILSVLCRSGSISIICKWFNQSFLKKFKIGTELYIKGKLEMNKYSKQFEVNVSDYEVLDKNKDQVLGIQPIYSITAGLTQSKMRLISRTLLDNSVLKINEFLPISIQKELGLIGIIKAIQNIHFPENLDMYNSARYRLAFDDFFIMQLYLAQKKRNIKSLKKHYR